MNNLHIIFAAAIVVGLVLIKVGASGERKGKEPPPMAQLGYLALIVGTFGLLAKFMSFAAAMLIFLLVAGLLMLVDRLFLKKRRGDAPRPDSIEYAYSFFPIILVVFMVRSFLVEPFQIPTSSMRPGLVPGDFILVNKFAYGIRLPIINKTVIPVGTPQRGDVMVFEYPLDRQTNFIKRVIGVPGDVVEYRDKQLIINGRPQAQTLVGPAEYPDDHSLKLRRPTLYRENVEGREHQLFIEDGYPVFDLYQVGQHHQRDQVNFPENCEYDVQEARWFRCVVPKGHYFMLGDNRDNSGDSRYWGFVPDNHIVGKAFFVWLNLGKPSRIGTSVQ